MALFGSLKDIAFFRGITSEFVENLVSQQVGYYKIMLQDTQSNIYGESSTKTYIGPVLIYSLIERGDFNVENVNQIFDTTRKVTFRFFKDHLVSANIVPEIGDVIMYNELYYLVDNTSDNQLIAGKDPDYSYSDGLNNFGYSYSSILTCHLSSGDQLGITQQKI